MALFPVHANERDPLGLFKAYSTFEGGEGGLLVRVRPEGTNSAGFGTQMEPRIDYADASSSSFSTKGVYGLLDEQTTRPETLFGSYLAPNADPVPLGPATHLGSGRVTMWHDVGYFLTDWFALELTATTHEGEGYGEVANYTAGDAMVATRVDSASGVRRGTLTDSATAATLSVATSTTRILFMQTVDDTGDLLASRVTPAPRTGMFREGPRILIYQT